MERNPRINPAVRILLGLLAVYAAAGMCISAAALIKTTRQLRELDQSLQETACEIQEVRQALEADESSETVRQQAFRNLSMVFPEDVVFFDGG